MPVRESAQATMNQLSCGQYEANEGFAVDHFCQFIKRIN